MVSMDWREGRGMVLRMSVIFNKELLFLYNTEIVRDTTEIETSLIELTDAEAAAELEGAEVEATAEE
jgi:hypothetical protein